MNKEVEESSREFTEMMAIGKKRDKRIKSGRWSGRKGKETNIEQSVGLL